MALKRQGGPLDLQRRVKARKEEDREPHTESEEESSDDDRAPSEKEAEQGDGADDGDSPNFEDDDESHREEPPKVDLSSVSFGALAKAQAATPASRKSKAPGPITIPKELIAKDVSYVRDQSRSGTKQRDLKRSSKHAPQEQSSKKPVSRRREILPDLRRKYRDPRFDTFGSGPVDEVKSGKAYAFLDEYRDKEMAELRAQIKKTKDPRQKEDLKRQLMSMESKKKAKQTKDEAENLLAEHRKKEKELVAQGKKPFFLKRSDQKKMLLTYRFSKMSKGQVDRAIERKRKKVAGKEKKELDFLQRRER